MMAFNKNGAETNENGLSVIRGNEKSTSYMQLVGSGLIYLDVGDYVSVKVRSEKDTSWTLHSESGFSVNYVDNDVSSHVSNNVCLLSS